MPGQREDDSGCGIKSFLSGQGAVTGLREDDSGCGINYFLSEQGAVTQGRGKMTVDVG